MAPIKINKENFETEVLNGGKVLLDFWAAWCGPCKMLSPTVDEIADESMGLLVGKVNVDEEPELAAAFNIMSIPTLVVLENGKVVATSVGVKPKAEILEMLNI